MSKRAKGMILFFTIVIIAIVVYLCCTYANGLNISKSNDDKCAKVENVTNSIESNVINNEPVQEENIVTEQVTEEKQQEKVQEPEESKVEEEPIKDNNSELESNDDESKAVEIVKKDWGDTEGFSFRVEQISGDGNYIVSVRNEDAIALEWYTVNPKNGKFTK